MTTQRSRSDGSVPISIKPNGEERLQSATQSVARKPSSRGARDVVREYPNRAQARRSFHDEASKALRDYEKTGLHVTHAKVKQKPDACRVGLWRSCVGSDP